ncbi:MAG TPA: hypothetical protein GX744_05675 [Firmicutes bacterium]|jgi:hypothetical protein|nr:hypothetical protein [Bacillota bacterium]
MMKASISKYILAVITLDPSLVSGGGAPVFVARDRIEQDRIATYMARITEGVVHDLENGVYILVKH